MMRWLVLIFLPTLVMLASGCSDEHVSHQIQIVAGELFNEDVAVQTSLPAELWEAMHKQAQEDVHWIDTMLKADTTGNPQILELQQKLKRNGAEAVDLDFLLARQRDYYDRYIDAEGIAIAGNHTVADESFREARNVILLMTAKHPELRDRLHTRHGFYMILYKVREGDKVPELYLYAKLLGSPVISLGACSKGSTLTAQAITGYCFAPEIMRQTKLTYPHGYGFVSLFAHEFGHAIETEIARLDANFRDKLKQAYATSIELETWGESYAASNWWEYWAEGVVHWFYDIGEGRAFENRQDFAERDPLLAELLGEWFIEGSISWHPAR